MPKSSQTHRDFLKNPLILALDSDDRSTVLSYAQTLGAKVGALKVGPRLLFAHGPDFLKELSHYAPLFIDHKFLDIPSTMMASVRMAFESGASMATIHCWAGPKALSDLALLERELSAIRPFKVLAVTVLTSFTDETMPAGLLPQPIDQHVRQLAAQAHKAGIRNFVCSPHEIKSIREVSPDAFIITPGIRLEATQDDQSRIATPQQAIGWGASGIVVGRPILQSSNPTALCEQILTSIST